MDIPLSSDALDVALHPRDDVHLLATGLISGKVQLIDYSKAAASQASGSSSAPDRPASGPSKKQKKGSEKQYTKKWTIRPSSKSCRGVAFEEDGSSLWTIAKDGSVIRIDTETGSVVSLWQQAHEAAPSRLLPIEKNLLATGDDDGVVKLWDPRRNTKPSEGSSASAVATYEHHFDCITSMLWSSHLEAPRQAKQTKEELEKRRRLEEKKRRKKERRKGGGRHADGSDEETDAPPHSGSRRERLVCTSGDGSLSVIDVRGGSKKKDAVEVSEDQEDELLSIAPVKRSSKLVVGTQLGILSLWSPSRGLRDHVDRVPGHPASVDTMCPLDDDTVLTGSSDGLVRVVQIMPHALLGIVADHGGMPVERIARHGNWLASIGHGPEVKLTDLAPLLDGDDDGSEAEEEGVSAGSKVSEQDREDTSDTETVTGRDDDIDDDEAQAKEGPGGSDGSDSVSNDDSDSDSDGKSEQAQKQPLKKARLGVQPLPSGGVGAPDGNDNFFADL